MRGTGTRAPSRWCATMVIAKRDQRKPEKVSIPLLKFSPVFDKSKQDRNPSFRRTRERGKDHSMKHCEQTWSGRVKIGKPTGRNLPLHHLHKMGGNTNIKTLNGVNTMTPNGEITNGTVINGENTSGTKSDDYRLFVWQPLCEDSCALVFFFCVKEFRLQGIASPLQAMRV